MFCVFSGLFQWCHHRKAVNHLCVRASHTFNDKVLKRFWTALRNRYMKTQVDLNAGEPTALHSWCLQWIFYKNKELPFTQENRLEPKKESQRKCRGPETSETDRTQDTSWNNQTMNNRWKNMRAGAGLIDWWDAGEDHKPTGTRTCRNTRGTRLRNKTGRNRKSLRKYSIHDNEFKTESFNPGGTGTRLTANTVGEASESKYMFVTVVILSYQKEEEELK